MKHKFNIIDIGVLVLIIALIVAAYLKFGVIEHSQTDTQTTTLIYTIKFANLRDFSVNTFKSGDTVYDSQTKLEVGTIKNIKVEEASNLIQTLSGDVVDEKNPKRFDVTLTIETEGIENEESYLANRSIKLKVGSSKLLETRYIKSSGTIMSVKAK